MTYKETVNISKKVFDKVNKLLEIESFEDMTDAQMREAGAHEDDCKNIYCVIFEDGCGITYDLCSGQNNYWDDVIFSSVEFGDSPVECTFELGDIELNENGNTYIVHINVEGE